MIPKPLSRRLLLSTAALLAAASAVVLVACGPRPTQVDRSPTAGMTTQDPTPGTFRGADILEAPANQAQLELTGDVEAKGAASVDCAVLPGAGGSPGEAAAAGEGEVSAEERAEGLRHARLTLGPRTDSPMQLVVDIPLYHGPGDYQASFHLQDQGDDGSYQESLGSGSVSLFEGNILTGEPATHWLSGSFRGGFQGAAGRGAAAGRIERCYYFE